MNYNKDRPKYLDIPIIDKNKKVIKWIKLPIMKNKLTLTHITVKEQKVSNLTISPFREETYKSKVIHEFYSNMAFFKILSDYFNIIKQNPKIAKQHKITDISFFRHKEFMEAIELQNYSGETNVKFKLNGNMFNYSFDQYRQNDEYYYTIILTSEKVLEVRGPEIYDIVLNNALAISSLRGKYLEMPRNIFSWTNRDLETRSFNDIFLPTKLMEDLQLYANVFDKKDKLMRYLLVGNPGTGKTESTLVLANHMKTAGVTIIKTPVDDFLKEKIQFAEALAPTVLIFDDLDLSIGSRSSGGYSPKELQSFLDAMDGTDKISKDVGIIATTNSAKLLDLAAQRPGRFEKILTFDTLTKQNIGNIILKSLRYNFDDKSETRLFFNKRVVDLFFDSGVTGAHVFNSINILKLKSELMDPKIVTVAWIIDQLTDEIESSQALRNIDHLNDINTARRKGLGFSDNGQSSEELDEPDYDEIHEDDYVVEGQPEIRRDSTSR